MLTTYLIMLGLGGVAVAMSALGGNHDADADADFDGDVDGIDGHADFDADADFDAHADFDPDADMGAHVDGAHTDGIDAHASFGVGDLMPLTSFRFWSFFLAAGGFVGTALTFLDSALGTMGIAAVTFGSAWAIGTSAAYIMKRLRKDVITSGVEPTDLVGQTARVLLPAGQGQAGRIRVRVKGQILDVTAEVDGDASVGIDDEVIVYEVRDDGTALIARPT